MEGPSLKSNLSLVSEMITYIRHLEGRLDESARKAADDQKQIQSAQHSIAQREAALGRNQGELRAQVASLRKLDSELSACREELAKVLSRAVEAEARRDALNQEFQRRNAEWAEQSRRLSEQLRGQKDVNLALRSELESLKKGFLIERESFQRNEASLLQKNRELIEKNRELNSTGQALDASVSRLIQGKDEAQTSNRVLQAQVDRMQATIQLLEGQLQDLRRNQGKGYEQARVAEDRGAAAAIHLAHSQKKVRDLEGELLGLRDRQSGLEQELATLRRTQTLRDWEADFSPGPRWS